MLIAKVGKISEHIDLLGAPEVPFYLVKGADWALIDAGVVPALPVLFEQFRSYPELDARLKYFLLTHSHFDHTGGLGYLIARFPQAKIIASQVTAEVFQKPKAVAYIKNINQSLAQFAGITPDYFSSRGLKEAELRVDQIVKEGAFIDLGDGVSLEVYDAPGHSRCSVVYVLNPDRALFSGEAIGFYNSEDEILPEALSSFKDFIATLEKLAHLSLQMLCLPHGGVLVGDEVKNYFSKALDGARKFQVEFAERIKAGESEEKILEQMAEKYYKGKIQLQPREVFLGNLKAMLLAQKKEMAE